MSKRVAVETADVEVAAAAAAAAWAAAVAKGAFGLEYSAAVVGDDVAWVKVL